jgi:DNA-binding response OmpR family regulator
MANERVLIVEDEATVAEVVGRYLERDGYRVRCVADGAKAIPVAGEFQPDLVVLDVMLPNRDGLEICRELRARGTTPIIMLTARGEETDKILGLGLGADDYVTKPFSPGELVARVKAVLRRTAGVGALAAAHEVIHAGDLEVDTAAHRVTRGGATIELTAKEFDLLAYLMRNAGRVLTKSQILDHVWGYDNEATSNVVEIYIHYLRDKVDRGFARPLIRTIRGVGYTIKE